MHHLLPLGFVEIEIPALAVLLTAAAAAIGWLVAEGLLGVYRRQVRYIVLGVARQVDKIKLPGIFGGGHPFRWLSNIITATYYSIDHAIAHVALDLGNAAAVLFKFFLDLNVWMATEIQRLALDTYHALQRSTTTTVTKVKRITGPTIVKPLRTKIVHITKTSTAALTRLNRRVTKLEKRLAHLPKLLVPAVGFPLPRGKKLEVGLIHLEKRVTNQGKRITRLEKKVFAAGAGGVIIGGLVALGMDWIRCPSAQRFLRGLKCIHFDILGDILSPLVEAFIVLDLCRFALAAQALAREIVPALGLVLLVQDAVCLGGGASLPSAADNPNVTTSITLPSASG